MNDFNDSGSTRPAKCRTRKSQGSAFILSIPLIAIANIWTDPPRPGWLDTQISYSMRYTLIRESGTRYSLSPRFFEPYGDALTMSPFSYLTQDHRVLTGPYGVIKDRALAETLAGDITAGDIFSLESSQGKNAYDAKRASRFYEFVKTYLVNWNRHGGQIPDLEGICPPPQFWTTLRGTRFSGQEKICELIVREATTLYDGKNLEVIREQVLAQNDLRSETIHLVQ